MGVVSSLAVTHHSYLGSVEIMAVPNTPYSTTSNVSLSTVAASGYSLREDQKNMQRLNANLYAVFLDQMHQDGPPTPYDYLDEDDICRRKLPNTDKEGHRNYKTYCESLKGNRLHVAQYLAYQKIRWFDPVAGKVVYGKRGQPPMCKCEEEVDSDGEAARPRYKED